MTTVQIRTEIAGKKGSWIVYQNGEHVIISAASPYLGGIESIVDFDNGLLTFMEKHSKTGETVEEYLDLESCLIEMGIEDNRQMYFDGVKAESICIMEKA